MHTRLIQNLFKALKVPTLPEFVGTEVGTMNMSEHS